MCSVGVLRVEAEASTDKRPLHGFTPRKGKGLAVFGKSQTGPPAKKDMRIDFQFDRAAFNFRCVCCACCASSSNMVFSSIYARLRSWLWAARHADLLIMQE